MSETEKQWMQVIIDAARLLGWQVYHPFDSRRSTPGFPDLTLVRERVVFAEVKTQKGSVSRDQRVWLDVLKAAGAEVYLWRPSHWVEVQEALSRKPTPLEATCDRCRRPMPVRLWRFDGELLCEPCVVNAQEVAA